MNKRTIGDTRFGNHALAAALFAVGLALAGCSEDKAPADTSIAAPPQEEPKQEPSSVPVPKGNPVGTGEKVSKTIDNATGGSVELSDGTKIEIPPGALPPGVDTIAITSSTEPAPSDYSAVSPLFVFEPHGTVFLKPLKVSLAFAGDGSTDTSKLTILWSRQRTNGYDMVSSSFAPSGSGLLASGDAYHFSSAFVGQKYEVDPRPSSDPYGE